MAYVCRIVSTLFLGQVTGGKANEHVGAVREVIDELLNTKPPHRNLKVTHLQSSASAAGSSEPDVTFTTVIEGEYKE